MLISKESDIYLKSESIIYKLFRHIYFRVKILFINYNLE